MVTLLAPISSVQAEPVEASFFFFKKEMPFDRLRANGSGGGE
jgi:hypothetical protein